MAFYAREFSFDGIPSSNYALTISSTTDGSEVSTNFPGDVKLFTEKLFNRTDEFYYGASVEPSLEFPVTFLTDNEELMAVNLEKIGLWLFGKRNYSDLKILQPDMQNVTYRCFMLQPKIIRIGNTIKGVSALVHSKDPWGLSEEKMYTYTFTPPVSNVVITNNNLSDDSGYLYPNMTITMADTGGDISITNTSDNNRVFSFSGLLANEVITIDNSLQIISSNSGLRRLGNFNKNFLRLVSGSNNLLITGAVTQITLEYAEARKIGG